MTSFDIHTFSTGPQGVAVYFKKGSFAGFDTDPSAWTIMASTSVNGLGFGVPTPIPSNAVTPLDILAGQTYSFYVTLISSEVYYTNGNISTIQDANLQFIRGVGKSYPFGGLFSPRIWNGILRYSVC